MKTDFSLVSHEDLALMAQQGNHSAEEFLIRQYKDVVRGKAHTYFIMGADGEDVVQEAMIGLFKAIKSYSPEKDAGFKTYAILCINRQIFDAIKAANRNKHSPLNTSVSLSKPIKEKQDQTLEETLVGKQEFNPEALIVMKDLMSYISTNEENLFSDFEINVWNGYMEGKSYNEIAKDLEKTSKAIYNAMERIKKKIATYLRD